MLALAPEITEFDPNLKNAEWGNKVVQSYRYAWKALVDPERARKNMKYLLNDTDMTNVKKMFKKDGEGSGISFISIAAMEKLRNILIAERDKAGVFLGLNALDPTVVEASRKKDRDLLKNRKNIEAVLSTLRAKIGEPPYKLKNEKFEGNIDDFDEIGLNDEDDEDINYFFSTFWRLLQEIKGQLPLNYFVKYNELPTFIPFWCNDILAKKAIAAQVFVNQTSGAIQYEYIAPEQVRLIPGKRRDNKDAPCIGFEQQVTVHKLMQHLGREFTSQDYKEIIASINFTHNKAYTGLHGNGGEVVFRNFEPDGKGDQNVYCGWSAFNSYMVTLGYMEFKSIDSTATKLGVSRSGNLISFPLKSVHSEVESEHYQKDVVNNEKTYKAYFIPTSDHTQRVYRFGPLYHQTTEGGEDELSNYSICTFLEVGPTAVEIVSPYLEMINQAWAKFEWMVRKAKPDGRVYNYEALVQIANNMIKEGDVKSKVTALMAMFEEGINEIYVIPTVGGQRVGGGSNPYFEKKNGLSAAAKEFIEVIIFCNGKIESDLGLNGLVPYTPSPNDGFKLHQQQVAQSRNATEYMSTMILNCLKHMGTQTLLMCQDIIKYKSSVPYKFLVNAVGQDTVNAIEQAKFAHSRLGIFVESFNTQLEREEQKRFTQDAFMKGELGYEQMMLINSIDDYKKAGMVLAYEKKRAEKRKQQELDKLHEQQMQQIAAKNQGILEQIALKNKGTRDAAEVEGKHYEAAHKRTADAMIERKEMEIENSIDKIDRKTEGEIKKDVTKESLKQQSPT